MFVISPNSMFTYKGTTTKAEKVSEDLGVRYVLKLDPNFSLDWVRNIMLFKDPSLINQILDALISAGLE